MRLIYLTFLGILASVAVAVAQEQKSPVFTLEQCITYALENSDNVKNAALDEQIAGARVKETRGIGLPQVNGEVNLIHNIEIQRFFNTSAVVAQFTGAQIDGTNPSDIVAAASPFQLKSAGTATITASQILFNGSYLVGLQAANAYRDLSVKMTNQTKENLISQVTKAYYTTLINQERIKLFDSNISRVESLLRTTRALNENGFAESIDVDRIRVTLNNLTTEREKFRNLQLLSTELLKFQMNYPMDQNLEVVGQIENIVIPEKSADMREEGNYTDRSDYQVLIANQKLQALDLKNKFAEGLPSLVAFGTYGYFTQSADIGGLFRTETSKDAAFPEGIGPDKWFSYSNVGVTLSVPLFSGLQRSYRVQQAKLNLRKTENNIAQLKDAIALEIKQASAIYDNSLKTLVSQKENMELAENVSRVTQIKYEQGVGSNIEVIDAESALKEAQINYYNALYDALVAKVDLDKAYGKLNPENNPQTND